MNIGPTIKKLRRQRGWSQMELAEQIGTDSGNISRMERGQNFRLDFMMSIAKAFNLRPSEFLNLAEDLEQLIEVSSTPMRVTHQIPLLQWDVAYSLATQKKAIPIETISDWISCPGTVGRDTIALRVEGNSMVATHAGKKSYPSGSIIFVDPDKEYGSGATVIAALPEPGILTFKEYIEDSGRIFLRSIDSQIPTMELPEGAEVFGAIAGTYIEEDGY